MGAVQEFDYEKISLLFRRIAKGQDSNLWGQSRDFRITKEVQRWSQKISDSQWNFDSITFQLDLNPLTPEPFDNQNSDIIILTPDPQIFSVARRAELEAENQALKT